MPGEQGIMEFAVLVTAPQGHFSLLQATAEPLSPPQSTRYAPIPTILLSYLTFQPRVKVT